MPSRPCQCDKIRPGPIYTLDQCRLCWLYHHEPAYQALWNEPALTPAVCQHRGPDLGVKLPCPGCPGAVRLTLFACALHGRCTPSTKLADIACCLGCPDYLPLPGQGAEASSERVAAAEPATERNC
jgi:hypothetical protein